MSEGIPVIRLTLEGFRMQILAALTEREMEISNEIKRAVEEYLTPENIEKTVGRVVQVELDKAINEEVDHFYRIGPGRHYVRDAIRRRLMTEEDYERQYGRP